MAVEMSKGVSKGLTLTLVFDASSLNGGEGVGNYSELKKIMFNGELHTMMSRQALSYELRKQMGVANTPIVSMGKIKADKIEGEDGNGEKSSGVLQYHPDATIVDYPEIDLFGYMKTDSASKTRKAVVRLSNAISLEAYKGDVDFLTNKGMYDRFAGTQAGGNIAQIENHKSLYVYTMTLDLDSVGVDVHCTEEVPKEEKARRVVLLLDTILMLYRDIKGRRENMSPVFVVGGLYERKNPFFQNAVALDEKGSLDIERLQDALDMANFGNGTTHIGMSKVFKNHTEIETMLNTKKVLDVFKTLKTEIEGYYGK